MMSPLQVWLVIVHCIRHTERMDDRNRIQSKTLVLVPTELELSKLNGHADLRQLANVELCGFGPVEAAARTAAILARTQPDRVLLVGIAGSYDSKRLSVGTAACFLEVTIDGVGAGSGADFRSATELGFSQVSQLPLHWPRSSPEAGLLVTCCAASANAVEANDRKSRFPEAAAEDMEGFAVALACHLATVPLAIVRGISNITGDRDHSNWMIDEAVAAAAELARSILTTNEPWELPS